MAIIAPSSFKDLMERAPRLNEQGGNFAQIPAMNTSIAAGLVGKFVDGKTDLAIADLNRRSALEQIEAQRKSTLGDRLRLMAPLLATSGGLFGGDGGGSTGNRMAGDLLAASLQQGFMTPNALLGATNDFLGGMNLFRAQGPEAWTASSRKGTQSILPWLS